MTCDETRELLSGLLDEALTPEDRRTVEGHLEGCAECRRELERLRQTVALLHRVVPAHAPVGFVDHVVAAARPRPWYRRAAAAVFLPLSAKLPVEATALVMIALLAAQLYQGTPTLQQAARQPEPASPTGPSEPRARASKELKDVRPGQTPRAAPLRETDRRDLARQEPATRPESQTPASPQPAAPAPAPPQAPAPAGAPTAPAPPVPMVSTAGSGVAAPPAGSPAPALSKAEQLLAQGQAATSRAETESRQATLERAAGTGEAPSSARQAAKRAEPSTDVVARAPVKDRDAAERDLAELIARVGGRQTQQRRDQDATIVEAVIPRERYAEFSQALATAGPWRVEAERTDLSGEVRATLRLPQ